MPLTQGENLKKAIDSVTLRYDWAEFGVAKGGTAGFIASHMPAGIKLYLFDSYLGLPEDFTHADGTVYQNHYKGTFRGLPPEIPSTVRVDGYFKDTVKSYTGKFAFMHIDCDLYQSVKEVLVNDWISAGTIIVFDDYHSYGGNCWKEHSYKAFMEFVAENDRRFEYIGSGERQAAVRINW